MNKRKPTHDEIVEYMELHNNDEVGQGENAWDFKEAECQLLLDDKYYYKNDCTHEDDIFYMDLVQFDGLPYYTVKCMTCEEYGTIQLEEGENIFGMSENEIDDFKNGALK